MAQKWKIRRYEKADAADWDIIVRKSRQGSFMHLRGYMDYHSDRFADCSLIASCAGRPDVILPANLTADGTLWSHQGLTFAGWLTPREHFDGEDMLGVFDALMEWGRENGVSDIVYKPVPHIYHVIPAQEDIYALFRMGADTKFVNLSSAVDMRMRMPFNSQQKRNVRKGKTCGLRVESGCVEDLMKVLVPCLKERHDATPVHSEMELRILAERFPDNIKIHRCLEGEDTVAVVCIYDCNGVAHCQYIATTERGREVGAFAYMVSELVGHEYAGRHFFDFGTSNEDTGKVLNSSLLRQKAGFGASGVAYPAFVLSCDELSQSG